MLHRQPADVQEPLGAVGHASLLCLVQLALLDVAGDAFCEAHVGQRVHSCNYAHTRSPRVSKKEHSHGD